MDHLVVSNNRLFFVSQLDGDIRVDAADMGLFHDDMRHLSKLHLLVNNQVPTFLHANATDMFRATMLLTNTAPTAENARQLMRRTVSIERERLVEDRVYDRITLNNYNPAPVALVLSLVMEADFADLFALRGIAQGPRGHPMPTEVQHGGLVLAYEGTEGKTWRTAVYFSRLPQRYSLDPGADLLRAEPVSSPELAVKESVWARVDWELQLEPDKPQVLDIQYVPQCGDKETAYFSSFDVALTRQQASYSAWHATSTQITSSNPEITALFTRSTDDLRALTIDHDTGTVPIGGLPWYAVPFGRDSVIISLEALCFRPDLARGTLRFLAAHQGTTQDAWRDEAPGKIMHELRFGELAVSQAIPHTPYFGSIDATLLFLMLFASTMHWTGDRNLYHELQPAVMRALEWIDRYGDLDGDGYVEFLSQSERGLGFQGWKDSVDSVLYPDGTLVAPPLALVEVQAYVYAAKTGIASVLRQMGSIAKADQLDQDAAVLKARFNHDFWLDTVSYYTQALDHDKQPVLDITSNPGHALMCGIIPPERVYALAIRLTAPDMLSKWGIRTRSTIDPNFNPMRYHNGSIWPHDNALIIYGLHRCAFHDAANLIASRLLSTARYMPLARLPELVCGFDDYDQPIRYPTSCSPQGWAAAAPFLILQGMLGLEADAWNGKLHLAPHLPEWFGQIEVKNLQIGHGRVDLRVYRDTFEVIATDSIEVVTR